MTHARTDLSLTLEQLTGLVAGNPDEAPTSMVEAIIRSWKKPLNQLSDDEIGELVVQHDGYPYVLDLVWPKLESDPLFDGAIIPGTCYRTSFVRRTGFGMSGWNTEVDWKHFIEGRLSDPITRTTLSGRVFICLGQSLRIDCSSFPQKAGTQQDFEAAEAACQLPLAFLVWARFPLSRE